ncbi:SRPBCC family protein [Uliginosibacterium sp. H1]|uniref:SRPBCC family protein n=1 Tax=Uliginosibacterium sp. H1 TaxID=3114757 RepID=UPI002E19E463|nr:SRPBCC domain-containing protein [Uliginosibacterium sp. H1]
MKTLMFEVTINASPEAVWKATIGPETYKEWTAAFCEGSYFTGSWDEGARIQFLSPGGDGMVSVIAEHKPAEYVSIKHIGVIEKGVEDTSSEKVRSWTPAYENYRFTAVPGGTRFVVTVDTVPEYEQFMQDTFPKALALLKGICEK